MVALFDDEEKLNAVIEELQIVGFDRAEITVSSSWRVDERTVGREPGTLARLGDDPDVPRAVPVDSASLGLVQGAFIAGPLYLGSCGAMIAFFAGGASFAMIATAGIAAGVAGAALGILPVIWVRRWHRRYIDEMLAHGGLVLWVCISDAKSEKLARTILVSHLARDVRIQCVTA